MIERARLSVQQTIELFFPLTSRVAVYMYVYLSVGGERESIADPFSVYIYIYTTIRLSLCACVSSGGWRRSCLDQLGYDGISAGLGWCGVYLLFTCISLLTKKMQIERGKLPVNYMYIYITLLKKTNDEESDIIYVRIQNLLNLPPPFKLAKNHASGCHISNHAIFVVKRTYPTFCAFWLV